MTQDLRLRHVCPHQVICEALALEADRRTIRTVIPPSSSFVELSINGHKVPNTGVISGVTITGLNPGPYTIETGDNDTFAVSINGGATQEAALPTGVAVAPELVASAINTQIVGLTASVTKGRLTLTQDARGEQATLQLEEGNAHATLGFPALRFYRGRTAIPGWKLVRDPNSPIATDRVLLLDRALPSGDDRIEVSYITRRDLCRRCAGLGLENDFRYDTQGNPVFVTNEALLLQEVEKIVFTVQGSNVFHTWYGTSLLSLIGTKIGGRGGAKYLETQLVTEIQGALDRYLSIKERQAQVQPVTVREQLSRVRSIAVNQDRIDPTLFRVQVALENRANEIITFEDSVVVFDTPVRIN